MSILWQATKSINKEMFLKNVIHNVCQIEIMTYNGKFTIANI